MKFAQDLVLAGIMAGGRQGASISLDEIRQHVRLAVKIRQSHQMKSILSRPTKAIFAACAADPKSGIRPLHRFRKHRNVLVAIKSPEKFTGLSDQACSSTCTP